MDTHTDRHRYTCALWGAICVKIDQKILVRFLLDLQRVGYRFTKSAVRFTKSVAYDLLNLPYDLLNRLLTIY